MTRPFAWEKSVPTYAARKGDLAVSNVAASTDKRIKLLVSHFPNLLMWFVHWNVKGLLLMHFLLFILSHITLSECITVVCSSWLLRSCFSWSWVTANVFRSHYSLSVKTTIQTYHKPLYNMVPTLQCMYYLFEIIQQIRVFATLFFKHGQVLK